MTRSYGRLRCDLCDASISQSGQARISHLRRHAREGLLVEKPRLSRLDAVEFEYTPEGRGVFERLHAERQAIKCPACGRVTAHDPASRYEISFLCKRCGTEIVWSQEARNYVRQKPALGG